MGKTGAVQRLRDAIAAAGIPVFEPGTDGYAKTRAIWNGAVAHEPALAVHCRTTEDIRHSLAAARAHGVPVSVRGGGHDWAGRALRQDGLVLDLSPMRQVTVNAAARTAIVAGGATATDLAVAAAEHGLAAVTGNVGAVGMAGFMLAGGYGPLTTRFGLAIDNLLGAELVLADGRRIWADAAQNAELFWALRGGGGNFGVVTSMHIRLHAVGELLAGLILFPWSQAAAVLRGHAEILASAPDELSVLAGVFAGPDGAPAILLSPAWSGEPSRGREIMGRLERLGTPILSQIAPLRYLDILRLYDQHVLDGYHHIVKTRWLADLTPEIIAATIEAGGVRTSPYSFIALHHCHGAPTRVAKDATAFGQRRNHFMMEIVAAWGPGDATGENAHRRWVDDLFKKLAPHALPGGYANFLTQEDHEQIASAYGGNGRRVREIKQYFDPENLFASAIPLPD
ncbi:MAG TPA: FAD-binding oxidoreductase [Aliidongia sp.]|nr:FAD-binding oxidoreductase [Aliidongia sp.]